MQNEVLKSTVSARSMNFHYMPQLDALRAFAVMFVLFEHWLSEIQSIHLIPFGMIGVTLFFVLSGFLITQILITGRINSEEADSSKIYSIRQFYIRRTLRIFPIYYLTIFAASIFNIQNIREKILWFLFYASNIYFYKTGNWDGSVSHLWTLAVEEQFYIVWPFIIFFIPKKYLLKSIWFFILLGPLFRTALYALSGRSEWELGFIYILTPSCMDCFSLGALLAYYRIFVNENFTFSGSKAKLFLLMNFVSIAVLLFFEENLISVLLFRFNVSFVCLWIISKASIGFKGILKPVFENKTIMYIGKISYGIYLYHNFIPLIYSSLKLPPLQNLFLRFSVYAALLILISSISWFLIEKPINGLKKYFT